MRANSQYVDRDQARDVTGAVVVIDVLRAFTTAAYAFAAGAKRIILVSEVAEALDLKRMNPDWMAMGEDRGRRIDGFDLSNSPVEASRADLTGRTVVQRTSAGTRGATAAVRADRIWCTGLVTASATARAVQAAGLGDPTYVITGCFPDRLDRTGLDDLLTAKLVERARRGEPLDTATTAHEVATSDEAARTLAHGAGHADPADIDYATRVDHFDFAMEARAEPVGLVLRPN
jgi:2-phosphosulfolactate phosphatase